MSTSHPVLLDELDTPGHRGRGFRRKGRIAQNSRREVIVTRRRNTLLDARG